ncbi:Flp pilus assembly complex ATPase component TadA, partial [bacterium]|nr:Flp pilus assembly complex ATPase component TadA [bacterium]
MKIIPLMNDLDIGSIIADAQKKRASSIHIHPNKNEIVIRYKIDGIYHNIRSLSLNHKSELSAKLKILAMLDITERRIPQTGFFTFEKDNLKLKISISTLPTIFGERICLKFLDNHKNRPEKLFELGMTDTQIETLCLQLKKNSSLIVSAGPAGSGKSTMLKCLVSEIDSTQNNIMSFDTDTFTDDQNICQIKTSNNDGFSLSTGIRHAKFQEADIIIADIEDCETID